MPTLKVNVIEAQNLLGADIGGSSDPYCTIKIGYNNQFSSIEKTRKIKNTKNPTWKETFTLPVNNPINEQLYIEVFNKEKMSKDDSLGFASIPLNDLARGVEKQVWLQLEGGTQGGNIIGQIASHLGKKKGHPTNQGRVLLGLTAMDFGLDPSQHQQMMGMQPVQQQQGGLQGQQGLQQEGQLPQQQLNQQGLQGQQGYQQGQDFQQGTGLQGTGMQPSGSSYQPGMPSYQQGQGQQGQDFQQSTGIQNYPQSGGTVQQPGYQQGFQQPGVSSGQEFSGQSGISSGQSGVSAQSSAQPGMQYQPSLSATVPPQQQQMNQPAQQTVYPPNL